jgi:alpha-glucosidase (family GH31 glycosyl hydrolase)
MKLKDLYVPKIDASPNAENVVEGEGYRLTVLTDRLFRVEVDKGGFLDLPSQSVWKRNLGKVEFEVGRSEGKVEITTKRAKLVFFEGTKKYKAYVLTEGNSEFIKGTDGDSKKTPERLFYENSEGADGELSDGNSKKTFEGLSGKNAELTKETDANAKSTERAFEGLSGGERGFSEGGSKKVKTTLCGLLNNARGLLGKDNLKGTKRTLDGVFGPVKLGDGIMSRSGAAAFDDKSLVLRVDGTIGVRGASRECDVYVFAYGDDYLGVLRDFYGITGEVPQLPRYSLGNWWSRYYEYTDTEYLGLMKTFKDNGIPFSVATIDMDWHRVSDVPKKYGSGWTGYTWNKELFKDPKAFLKGLKDEGYKITLNLHPADGCRAYEEYYNDIAEHMGIDKNSGAPVKFDMTNPNFVNAYFECLHYPLEKMGVDFWWIDWQQGKKTSVDNLDPLWLLNHYHTLDNAKDGRPLILSRYAGIGSHRYQLGFSGDTYIGWKMLNFMPYFTSVASNVGFTWWSHDIGGHHFGKRDGELYLRWVQQGVFSPVLRLHGSKNLFINKSPLNYRADIRDCTIRFLRLRHKLIPYIYTMNYLNRTEGIPLCMPMYYKYKNPEFYAKKYRNMYMFGSELIVAPITRPAEKSSKTEISYTDAFLPKGNYTDIFTGFRYEAGDEGLKVRMFRELDCIPVLARDGAVLTTDENCGIKTANPEKLRVTVFPGENNSFKLYEDDGESADYKNGAYALTEFELKGNRKDFTLTIKAPEGDISVIPAARTYRVELFGVAAVGEAAVTCKDGREVFSGNSGGERKSGFCGGSSVDKDGREVFSGNSGGEKKSELFGGSAAVSKDGEKTLFFDGRSVIIDIETDKIYEDIKIEVKGADYAVCDKDEYIKNAADKIETGFFKKAKIYKKYKKDGKFRFRGLKGIDKELNGK